MVQTAQRIYDWLLSHLLSKLADLLQHYWRWVMLGGVSSLLAWVDWHLLGSLALILLGACGAILDKRRRDAQLRDADKRTAEADARADAYKQDMDITWLQSRSFELDPNKRRKAVVQFISPQMKPAAEAIASLLEDNGWDISDGPIPFYPEKPEVSLAHTVKLELHWGRRFSRDGPRYVATLQRLTGHKVYSVDGDASDTEPALPQEVLMRITVYGPKPALDTEKVSGK